MNPIMSTRFNARRLLVQAAATSMFSPLLARAADALPAADTGLDRLVRFGGTGSALGIFRVLGEAWSRQTGMPAPKMMPSLGTSGGLKAVKAGALDVALAARVVPAEPGLVSWLYATTPYVIAVNSRVSEKGVTVDDLLKIWRGHKSVWSDGSPIRPIARPDQDANSIWMASLHPDMGPALANAHARAGFKLAVTDSDAAEAIEQVPHAIGVLSLGQVLSERRHVRILMLDGRVPTSSALADGSYPHSKPLTVVYPETPAKTTRQWLDWLRQPVARKILADYGYLPAAGDKLAQEQTAKAVDRA